MDKLQNKHIHKHHTFRSVFDKEDPEYKEVSETTFRESYVMPDQNIRLGDAADNKVNSGSISSSNRQIAVNDQDGSVGRRSSSSSSDDSTLNERHHRKLKKKGGLQDNVSQYGNVFPVKTKMLGREFMCKISKITAMTKERDYKKHLIPQMVHHKNIIVIHDALIVKQDKLIDKKYFAIMMEKCQYNLYDFMLKLSQDQDYKENLDMRLEIIDQLLEVMAFLHERNIVHLGLKPENILLNEDGTVKISDFGDYTEFDDKGYDKVHKVKKLKHKVKHMFQHTVRGEEVNSIFFYKRKDIYRLGAIILVIALYPKIDFNEKFLDFEDLKFSEKKILELVDHEVKDPTLRELLPNMLYQKTKNRLNMRELLKIWKHKNVSKVGKIELFFKKHIKREKIKEHEQLGFEDANIDKHHNVEPNHGITYQNQHLNQNVNPNYDPNYNQNYNQNYNKNVY